MANIVKKPDTVPVTNPGHRRKITKINVIDKIINNIPSGNNGFNSMKRP